MLAEIITCIVIPLLFFSLILKKDARHITLYLCIGTVACYLACLLNTLLLSQIGCTYFYLTITVAPITEELLKFVPIFIISLVSKNDTEKVFPAAFALGIGFAITENLYMLSENAESVYIGWIILRGISTGLMHAMSASIISLGVSSAKKNPELRLVGIIATVSLAIIYHGFFNCLVNNIGIMKYIGITIPIVTYAIIFFVYRRDAVKAIITNDFNNDNNKNNKGEKE